MGSMWKLAKGPLSLMGMTFLSTTGRNILTRPTVQSSLRACVRWVFTGTREKPCAGRTAVGDLSSKIVQLMDQQRVSPTSICIDGLPGSGKSSLGRDIARKTGLVWKTLYWNDLKDSYPFRKGMIYENIRLIRTQDIEHFDMLVYVDCDISTAMQRVMERDRDGILIDVMDFSKLKRIGDTAFELAAGEEVWIPGSCVRIKFRPREGYRDLETLKSRLRASGIFVEDLSKEELLFAYCYGKPQQGIYPYLTGEVYGKEILSGLSEALKAAFFSKCARQ